jgi:hypothetical protein
MSSGRQFGGAAHAECEDVVDAWPGSSALRAARLYARRRRPRGSASRAASRRSARAPRRSVAPALRVADLLLQHGRHQVRHGPHALADLRLARQAAGEPDVDVPVLVGADPGSARFMSPLRLMAPASMLVWISSPVRSRKPVLMKIDPARAARMHSLRLTVVRRSSSMMPILRVLRRAPARPRRGRTVSPAKADLLGPVHLRLDDVDRAGTGIAQGRPVPFAGRAGRSAR